MHTARWVDGGGCVCIERSEANAPPASHTQAAVEPHGTARNAVEGMKEGEQYQMIPLSPDDLSIMTNVLPW